MDDARIIVYLASDSQGISVKNHDFKKTLFVQK